MSLKSFVFAILVDSFAECKNKSEECKNSFLKQVIFLGMVCKKKIWLSNW